MPSRPDNLGVRKQVHRWLCGEEADTSRAGLPRCIRRLATVFLIVLLCLWLGFIESPVVHDDFAFLRGRRPISVRVGRVLSPPWNVEGAEERIYSWHGSKASVSDDAEAELRAKGFSLTRQSTFISEWQGPALLVTVVSGHALPSGSIVPEEGWTSVVCDTPLPNGLWTKGRLLVQDLLQKAHVLAPQTGTRP